MSKVSDRRILVIDDNASILADYRRILGSGLAAARTGPEVRPECFELVSAHAIEEGLERVREAVAEQRPYALAFVDVRRSSGIDTLRRIWELDTDLQVVICTASSDCFSEDLAREFGCSDRLLILKKPFEAIEVAQLATALSERWISVRRERASMAELRRSEAEARSYVASMAMVNRALEAAQACAQATSASKFEFLGRLAAVLQESSTALHAALELASGPGQGAEAQRRGLESASARCDEICNTARNLALHSGLDREVFQPAQVPYSPGALLDETVARWRARAEARGLRLAGECLGVLPVVVRGDKQLVAGILDALVDNALRFTPSGVVRLTARMPLRDEGQEPALVYSVIDTGPGIPAAAQARAFEAFVHEAGWGARGQGAHFSLHTARRLVRFLGGNLELESTPGSGCRFHVHVPAGDLAGVEFAVHPPGALPGAGPALRVEELRP